MVQPRVLTQDSNDLAQLQRTVIKQMRFTEQFNRPMTGLVTPFNLGKGERQLTLPKGNEFAAKDVEPGIDLVETQDLDPSIVTAVAKRIGMRIVILDDLADQFNEDVFKYIGRAAGEAIGVKQDTDLTSLFSGFSKALGADNKNLILANANACIAIALGGGASDLRPFGPAPSVFFVTHPNMLFNLRNELSITGATYPFPQGLNDKLLKNYFARIEISGVAFFHDGNINVIGATASGYGAIFHRGALGLLRAQQLQTRRTRDESLFAVEIVWSMRYGAFELDDVRGASTRYEIGEPSTAA